MRFRKRRYDPYPDLVVLQTKLMREDFEGYIGGGASGYLKDMIVYATLGKDRKKLTPEYVTRTEDKCRELMVRFAELSNT